MNKIILLFITVFSIIGNAFSQTEIPIKFSDLVNSYEQKYKHGEKYKIKINDINRFIYTVKSEKSEQDFNVEKPEIFKGIKLPGFLSTILPKAMPAQAPKEDGNKINSADLIKKINDSYAKIMSISEKVSNTAYLSLLVNNLTSDCKKDFNTIQAELKKSIDAYISPDPAGTNLPDVAAKLQTLLKKYITDSESELAVLESNTEEMIDLIKVETRKQTDIKILTEYDIHDEEAKCKEPCPITDDLKKLKADLRTVTGTINTLSSTKEQLLANLKEADDAVTEIKNFEKNGDLQKLMAGIGSININNFTFETEVFKAKKDEIIFIITSESEKPLSCDLPQTRSIKIEGRTYGGVKIDFSTGAFLNTGNNDFLGPEFYYKKENDSMSTIQQVDRGKRLLLSVGGLMHIYYNFNSKIKPSLSLGVSTSSGFDLLNFHGGISVILGDKQRIILSGGLTLRQSALLDTKYKLNNLYETAKLPEAVPTASVFPQSGGFFAITYNLSRLK